MSHCTQTEEHLVCCGPTHADFGEIVPLLVALCVFTFLIRSVLRTSTKPIEESLEEMDLQEAVDATLSNPERAPIPDNIPESEFDALIDYLFSAHYDPVIEGTIEALGTRLSPHFVEALERPRESLLAMPKGDFDMVPFHRICSHLLLTTPSEAIPALLRFSESDDWVVRQSAYAVLARIGEPSCVDAMKKAMRESPTIAMSTIESMLVSIDQSRATDEFLNAAYPSIAENLGRADAAGFDSSLERLLIAIDPRRALETLLADDHMKLENGRLPTSLYEFNFAEVSIPHSKLLPILKEVEENKEQFFELFCELMTAYGHNPDKNTEAFLKRHTKAGHLGIRKAAVHALIHLKGIELPDLQQEAETFGPDFDSLTDARKTYLSVAAYESEVSEGGHMAYFKSPSGTRWKEALTGLKELRLFEHRKVLEQAIALFGEEGPPLAGDPRAGYVPGFLDSEPARFEAVDERHFELDSDVWFTLMRFALRHQAAFCAADDEEQSPAN